MSELAHHSIPKSANSANRRDASTGIVKSGDGTMIAFDRVGTGPPVVLTDGALCHRGMGPSSPLAALLSKRYTVFTYDRRGRGASGDTGPYSVEREIEDLNAVIDEAGGSASVWGISSGAALALEVKRRGAGITKLALYEPPFIVDDSRPRVPADIVAQLTALIAADRRGDAVSLFLRQMGAPAVVIALMRLLPVWRKLTRIAHTLPYDMMIVAPYQAGTPLPPDLWNDVTIPTVVMVGGKSPAWFHHSTQALTDALPNATHQVIAGETHNVKAKALAPPLTEFYAS